MGRITKLNDLPKEFFQYLQEGNSIKTSANACGITDRTIHNWITRGKSSKNGKFFQFFQQYKKARAVAEIQDISVIRNAGDKTWQARAWLRERANPDDWGNKQYQKIEHSGKIDINTFKDWLKKDDPK